MDCQSIILVFSEMIGLKRRMESDGKLRKCSIENLFRSIHWILKNKNDIGHWSLVRASQSWRVLSLPELSNCFRSLELKPGKEDVVVPLADLRITNIALGDVLSDPSGRTTVKFTYRPPSEPDSDDEDEGENVSSSLATAVLCSLKPGTVRANHLFNYTSLNIF
jgi:hypothetical protein